MPCANLLSIKIETKSKESVFVTGTSTEKSSITIATTTSPLSKSFVMEPITPLDSKESTTSPKYSTSLWIVTIIIGVISPNTNVTNAPREPKKVKTRKEIKK